MLLIFRFAVLLILLILPLQLFAESKGSKQRLVFATADWCPYICAAGSEQSETNGYMVEVIKLIFDEMNFDVEIKMLPYEQSIELATKGEIDGILATTYLDAPELIFPKEEMGVGIDDFVTLKSKNWMYRGVDSLENIRLGTVAGYEYVELVDYFKTHRGTDKVQTIVGAGEGVQTTFVNLKKLFSGDVDVVLDNREVLKFHSQTNHMNRQVRFAGSLPSHYRLWLALSPKVAEVRQLCSSFNKELRKLRYSGKLEFILNKYGLDDWKYKANKMAHSDSSGDFVQCD